MMLVVGQEPSFEQFCRHEQNLSTAMEVFKARNYNNKGEETEAFKILYNWIQRSAGTSFGEIF